MSWLSDKWPRLCEIGCGIWLMASPRVLAAENHAATVAFACGIAVAGLACASFAYSLRYAHLGSLAVAMGLLLHGYFAAEHPAPLFYQSEILTGLMLLMFTILPSRASRPPEAWELRPT